MSPATDRHLIARCRWCGGRFVRFFHQWLCESPECAERQRDHAIERAIPQPDDSPFLFLPLPLQVDMQDSTIKRLLVAGAAGASKSYGARWHLYTECLTFPGYRALLLRVTYDELQKNHLQWMPAEALLLGDAKYSGGFVRQMVFNNGSMICCGYCDDAGDIPRHLGVDWDAIVFEEGVHFLPAALTEISARDRGSLSRRRIEESCDGRTLIVTNPGGRAMRFLIDAYISKQPDPDEYPHYRPEIHGFIPASLEDNPYLSENFAAETLSGLSGARYRQLRYGDWSVIAGQFFSTFDPAVHLTETEPAAWEAA